jgi:hypothetical protein
VVCYPLRDLGDEIGSGCKKRRTPPMKRGSFVIASLRMNNRDGLRGTVEPLLIPSEPVGLARFALHFGMLSRCCQTPNETYHRGHLAVRKMALAAAEILKARPRLPVRKSMPKGNLDGIGSRTPNTRSIQQDEPDVRNGGGHGSFDTIGRLGIVVAENED